MPLGRASRLAQVATDMWVDAMGKGSGQLPLAAGPQAGWGGATAADATPGDKRTIDSKKACNPLEGCRLGLRVD
jgi:hypothetical protein